MIAESNFDTFADKPIAEVVHWTEEESGSRLYLPPIQRSAVWRNAQIVQYWDSLLRGYPAGLMMVHHPKSDAAIGRDLDGSTRTVRDQDFLLFDGQQRLSAILLGLGKGQLTSHLKLWVDLGTPEVAGSDLRFLLRISSNGQPFGYEPENPNAKFSLPKRRSKGEEWIEKSGMSHLVATQAFSAVTGDDLIDSVCAVSLSEVAALVQESGIDRAIETLLSRSEKIRPDVAGEFVLALDRALKSRILFQVIDAQVIAQEEEYIRFFGRLGQGGTPLSNDELTYSIIKHHFPQVHDCMKDIAAGPAGRLTSEVNLVLGALRVAKVCAPWSVSHNWESYGRPQPAFVSRLRSELGGVREEFLGLIEGRRLQGLLETLRHRLVYDKLTNPTGLPVILLARLPHQLIDVLLLMQARGQTRDAPAEFLPSFVLYWLLFVIDSEKAANTMFRRFVSAEPDWEPVGDLKVIRHFEQEWISRRLPRQELLEDARNEIRNGTHILRGWPERFTALDRDEERPAADAIRALTWDSELIKRALLWLQRDYLAARHPDYDPTSSRDEDLPIDLDHLVPGNSFGFHWKSRGSFLAFEDSDQNFHNLRWPLGNSLGNRRWLDAPENRSRQDGPIDVPDVTSSLIDEIDKWNQLIEERRWTTEDVRTFQRIIDLRSIAIYETLLNGGLNRFTCR